MLDKLSVKYMCIIKCYTLRGVDFNAGKQQQAVRQRRRRENHTFNIFIKKVFKLRSLSGTPICDDDDDAPAGVCKDIYKK